MAGQHHSRPSTSGGGIMALLAGSSGGLAACFTSISRKPVSDASPRQRRQRRRKQCAALAIICESLPRVQAMIPKLNRGHSFKGLTRYLTHDKRAEKANDNEPHPLTSERVG